MWIACVSFLRPLFLKIFNHILYMAYTIKSRRKTTVHTKRMCPFFGTADRFFGVIHIISIY